MEDGSQPVSVSGVCLFVIGLSNATVARMLAGKPACSLRSCPGNTLHNAIDINSGNQLIDLSSSKNALNSQKVLHISISWKQWRYIYMSMKLSILD